MRSTVWKALSAHPVPLISFVCLASIWADSYSHMRFAEADSDARADGTQVVRRVYTCRGRLTYTRTDIPPFGGAPVQGCGLVFGSVPPPPQEYQTADMGIGALPDGWHAFGLGRRD